MSDTLDIQNIMLETTHEDWHDFFNTENIQCEIEDVEPKLCEYAKQSKNKDFAYFPHEQHIFRAYELSPHDVKVVIIGQDPYPGYDMAKKVPNACGWSFSTYPGVKPPVSLQTIFKEIINEGLMTSMPKSGDLSGWVEQGVMLLNMSLTRTPGIKDSMGSHGKMWYGITTNSIKYLVKHNPDIVFMLWGKDAQIAKKYTHPKNLVLEASHPSARSAYISFNGCDHFLKANEYLEEKGMEPIDWSRTKSKK